MKNKPYKLAVFAISAGDKQDTVTPEWEGGNGKQLEG